MLWKQQRTFFGFYIASFKHPWRSRGFAYLSRIFPCLDEVVKLEQNFILLPQQRSYYRASFSLYSKYWNPSTTKGRDTYVKISLLTDIHNQDIFLLWCEQLIRERLNMTFTANSRRLKFTFFNLSHSFEKIRDISSKQTRSFSAMWKKRNFILSFAVIVMLNLSRLLSL